LFKSMGFISKSTLGVILIVPPPLHHLATRETTTGNTLQPKQIDQESFVPF
jgi:hypothetical protein